MSVITTLGVLVLGVLPGILLAVALSLIWLWSGESRPNDAVLGRVKGQKGFHSIADCPDAKTIPGLLLYRFESNLVFYNADYMKSRVRAIVAAQKTPVEWLVLDASAINIVDATGLRKFDELRQELAAIGVSVYVARLRRHLGQFFNKDFVENRRERGRKYLFQTLKPAINAFLKQRRASELTLAEAEANARRKKARKSLMQALKPTLDDYLIQQQAAAETRGITTTDNPEKAENKRRLEALRPAISAYLMQQKEAAQRQDATLDTDEALDDRQWREPVELPRQKKNDIIPAPAADTDAPPADGTSES